MNTDEQLLQSVLQIVNELEDENTNIGKWLDEQLSVETLYFDATGGWKGGLVLCAFGGPNIYVDTATSTVEGYWGGDSYSRQFNDKYKLDDELEYRYGNLTTR